MGETGWSVREAEPSDADAILAASTALRGVPGPDPRPAIADPDRIILVSEADGVVVGWAKTHHYLGASGAAPAGHYLGGVSVLTDFRRRGIGDALTLARLDWIWDRASDCWFIANARNVASVALHERFGFEEVARASEFHGTTFDGGEGILFHLSSSVQ
jgi:aminoglycoside 6'-N-acetyltransferase I